MPAFKAVLFDLDGTLINSEYFYFECWNVLLQPYHIQITFEDWMSIYAGRTLPENAENLRDKYQLPVELAVLIQRRLTVSIKRFEEEDVPMMPHTIELLNFLRERNTATAIVTSSLRADVDAIFRRNGLGKYFSFIITKDDVQKAKPDPESYNLACYKLNLTKADCLVIEDTPTGLMAAKAAGLTCYAVQNTKSAHPQLSSADRVFTDLGEVQHHLLVNKLV